MQTNVSKEKLGAVKKIVYHANCADGMAAALICLGALGWELECVGMHYKSPELEALEATPGLLFVDFSPPADRADEFLDAGAIVLDHHKGAEDVVMKFVSAGQGAFADEKIDPGVSGASLACSEVWRKIHPIDSDVERFARLAGIRDTWQTRSKEWVEGTGLMLMMKLLGFEHFQKQRLPFPSASDYQLAELLGGNYHRKIVNHCDERVIVREVEGHTVAFHYDTEALTSDVAEEMRTRGANVIIGFFYVIERGQPKIIFSTRSDESFDVSKLCKFYGGGGHSRAAGFSQIIGETRDGSEPRFGRPPHRSPFDGEQNPWFFALTLFKRYVDTEAMKSEDFAPGV